MIFLMFLFFDGRCKAVLPHPCHKKEGYFMANIRKRGNKFQVQVRRVGSKSYTKTFSRITEARAWARSQEEREEHETKLWSIIEHLVEVGVSEDDFAEELGRRYDMLDGRKGNLFLSREGSTWRIKVSSSQYPHIETDYEFSIDG